SPHFAEHAFDRFGHRLPDPLPVLGQGPLVGWDCFQVQVFLDSLAAELTAGFWPDNTSVGLDLAFAVLGDVVLDVARKVVTMLRVTELLPGARSQSADPCQVVLLDEVRVQAEPLDDEVSR